MVIGWTRVGENSGQGISNFLKKGGKEHCKIGPGRGDCKWLVGRHQLAKAALMWEGTNLVRTRETS